MQVVARKAQEMRDMHLIIVEKPANAPNAVPAPAVKPEPES